MITCFEVKCLGSYEHLALGVYQGVRWALLKKHDTVRGCWEDGRAMSWRERRKALRAANRRYDQQLVENAHSDLMRLAGFAKLPESAK